MQIGLDVAQQRLPFAEIVDRAKLADAAGFDSFWGFDHFQPLYGSGPGECFEGVTTLAALTGHTSRVDLGLLVAGVTYRHPSVYAAQAITIDHASNGRFLLSLGAAWFEGEHRELGIPFPSTAMRIDMLDEALTIIRGLLTTDGFTFEGLHWQLHGATLLPRPVQQPHPPIWIGASGEHKMLPLVAKHADVWHTFGSGNEFARKSRLIDEHAERLGRDPASITRAGSLDLSQTWDRVRADAEELHRIGVRYLICGWPTEGRGHVEDFVERLLPDLQAM
jgi:alkanesulfonate monooxygenase SsuD/methylene tetrahydromethanopterin reductase-like flavin-dependent oxidoreductase (luciferase family)